LSVRRTLTTAYGAGPVVASAVPARTPASTATAERAATADLFVPRTFSYLIVLMYAASAIAWECEIEPGGMYEAIREGS
jgi:hypothetical protein